MTTLTIVECRHFVGIPFQGALQDLVVHTLSVADWEVLFPPELRPTHWPALMLCLTDVEAVSVYTIDKRLLVKLTGRAAFECLMTLMRYKKT